MTSPSAANSTAAAGQPAAGAIRVAAAPVSWGVFDQTAGDPLQPGPIQVLDQMEAAGYAGTEMGPEGYLAPDPAELRARLAARHLSLVGHFVPLRFSRREHVAEDRARLTRELVWLEQGQPDDVKPKVVLADASVEPERLTWAGRVREHPEAWLPPERMQVLIDNLHWAGEHARSRGFDPVLHFHAASYIETADEIRAVMDRLDTSLVGMCLDTGHARFGGADPVEMLREYGDIVRHVHIKDCDLGVLEQVRQSGGGMNEAWSRGVFCELGHGSSGLDAFLEALRARAWSGWLVVEQDRFLTPADTPEALGALHTRNRDWLRARGL